LTGDAKHIDFAVERERTASFAPLAYVCYDPYDLDRRHIELFRQKTKLVELAIPHGGHPVTGFMAEAGILGDFVLRIVKEQFDLSAFKSRAHTARKRSAQFWSVLSERARNPKVRTALAKRALAISPDDVVYQFKYARILAQYGNFEESEAIFNEAVRNHPTNPVLLYNLSEMHEWRGDFKEALSVMRRLVEAHPEAHIYDHRVAYLTNRFRVSTVMDSVGLIARRGFGRPINALLRRFRGGVDAFTKRPEKGGIQGAQPVETLVTTTPSPPPFVQSWLRHLDILRSAPQGPIDIMLVGDSHVEYWPSHMWGSLTTYNFGVAADKTQHILWRLAALPNASIRTADVVLLAGTNNLGADDTAIGIAAGLGEVAQEASRVAPDARLHILAVPPCGDGLEFRDHVRRQANALLRGRYRSNLVEADQQLRAEQGGRRLCYQEDNIHFSSHGYEVLTDLLLTRIRDERHRDARNSSNATK
jgi:tetratricopeptide (TPR) repeat protein